MIKKDIEIDGRKVTFRASATIPRLYRAQFGRDIFKDLLKLEKSVKESEKAAEEAEEESSDIPIEDLELFENVAYIMAKHADPSQPDTPEEWLDQFDTFSIYTVLPEILKLWNLNMYTDAKAKKNSGRVAGR